MERLELLLRITPAFAALAWKWVQKESDDGLYDQAVHCYSDIILIGAVLGDAEDPWRLGLYDSTLSDFLKAFQSRLPKRSNSFWNSFVQETESRDEDLSLLRDFARQLINKGLGGRNACLALEASDDYWKYLRELGSKVELFHDEEIRSDEKLGRFLIRVRRAKDHLLNPIRKDKPNWNIDDWVLEQHPSHKIWKLTEEIHALVKDHWNCRCSQWSFIRHKERQARLHLSRYRTFSSKSPAGQNSSKFEILLPNCLKGPDFQWKVTTFEVEDSVARPGATRGNRPSTCVQKDICQRLKHSRQSQVDFVADGGNLYHLQNQALTDVVDHYTTMESLHNLLRDEDQTSQLRYYSPKERIILCYILANALMFLFPGPWLSTGWNSTKLYFHRDSKRPNMSALDLPYLSTDMHNSDTSTRQLTEYQLHYHPELLGLAIMFLEIASGNRFTHTADKDPCERINGDYKLAMEKLEQYKTLCKADKSRQLFRSFPDIISSCLQLQAPPDLPTNQLWEVEPIRYYILLCVVRPLAVKLRDGYNISLERLHEHIGGSHGLERIDELGGQRKHSIGQQPPSQRVVTIPFRTDIQPSNCPPSPRPDRQTCVFSDTFKGEMPLDSLKVNAARDWIRLHECALEVVHTMRRSNGLNVNVAILDSGIQLSKTNQLMYNDFDPKFVYQDFVDEDVEWQDDIGHGTHLATLLRRIAPCARIHVARVFKTKPTSDDAGTISKALFEAVTTWEVDIIVMSFGFGEKQQSIHDAIEFAISHGVLLFAAACNDGNNHPSGVAWPANDPRVICVHSGDGLGNKSLYTPQAREYMRIMVLGEFIYSAWPEKFGLFQNHNHMSGTSCAAPIAAGIAAVLLDFSQGFLSPEDWKTFHEPDKMRKMFRRLTDDSQQPGYWWIKLWTMFYRDSPEGWVVEEIRNALR